MVRHERQERLHVPELDEEPGIPDHEFDGRPIIGICNTWSELTPCNAHFRKLAEHVKRGISEAGGFPVEFPVFSNGESNLRPSAMLTRNLASMDVEEAIRGNPIDAVVLLAGCDKTTPALLMGAASCDVPAIVVSGGPMLNGKLEGKNIGSGTAVWQLHEALKAGEIDVHHFLSAEAGCRVRPAPATRWAPRRRWRAWPRRSASRCRTTRRFRPSIRVATCSRTCPASASSRWRSKAVLSKILTRAAFENAIRANAAIGGSTNAVIHLKAIAGRIGVPLELEDWMRIGRDTPTIVDLMPSDAS